MFATSKLRRVALGLLTSLALPAAASAASDAPAGGPAAAPPAFHSTEWRVECSNSGTALDCQTVNRILQTDGQQLASITIHPRSHQGGVDAVVELPLGIALAMPVQLRVDDDAPQRLTLETCVNQSCIASAALAQAFGASLAGGKTVILSFGLPGRGQIAIRFPLTGFALAFNRARE